MSKKKPKSVKKPKPKPIHQPGGGSADLATKFAAVFAMLFLTACGQGELADDCYELGQCEFLPVCLSGPPEAPVCRIGYSTLYGSQITWALEHCKRRRGL